MRACAGGRRRAWWISWGAAPPHERSSPCYRAGRAEAGVPLSSKRIKRSIQSAFVGAGRCHKSVPAGQVVLHSPAESRCRAMSEQMRTRALKRPVHSSSHTVPLRRSRAGHRTGSGPTRACHQQYRQGGRSPPSTGSAGAREPFKTCSQPASHRLDAFQLACEDSSRHTRAAQ